MVEWFSQACDGVRFEWGPVGATALASDCACLVVVDVLSFTTAVSVAVDRGTAVYPYPWRDRSAAAFAASVGAVLAAGRREVSDGHPWSLSPDALRHAPAAERLVLPSPNGSAISAAAAREGVAVVASCLRNGRAVGRWLVARGYGTVERPILVVASGERWPDGSMRPALEDALGAGLVLATLLEEGTGSLSPEAALLATAYLNTGDAGAAVTSCASGLELATTGFAADVAIAVEINSSEVVPVFQEGAFLAAPLSR
ncbi:MAG TPA: 2-phosphosulfolactate phosphatase [Actinomycetes bacterium]|nr:2-phosphosulfolactate phosphatase [Actinomycetes bacterium]